MPCKELLLLSRGVCMVSSGVWVRMLRRSGRLLMAEPHFAAVAPHFFEV